jgi:Domain of unknown function (DUF1707)
MDLDPAGLPVVRATAIRASDLERERTAALLREHYLDGRLDSAEFQERLDACMGARTVPELQALSADLPRDTHPAERHAQEERRRRHAWRLTLALPLLVALVALSALAGRPLFFPIVPILFFSLRPFWWRSWRVGGPRYGRRTSVSS